MALRVLPVTENDFATFIAHADTETPGDDLCPGPYPLTWPVSTKEEAQLRARCQFHTQLHRFKNDPSVHYLKVVDETDGIKEEDKILAVGRWHFYESGYKYEEERDWEVLPLSVPDEIVNPPTEMKGGERKYTYPPPNLNVPLNNHILTTRDSFRTQWIPTKSPCWILMHLVTRPRHRRRGAANMIVRWGQEQAALMGNGIECFLEAGSQGEPVYRKCGFVMHGEAQRMDLRGFMEQGNGVPDGFDMMPMKWQPGMNMGNVSDGNKTGQPSRSAAELELFLKQAMGGRLP